MSVFAVNKLCYRAHHDLEFRAALKLDPAAALADLPLSEAERAALLAGEVGLLCEMGAHTFLLGHLSRWGLFGLSLPVYSERMRAARMPP